MKKIRTIIFDFDGVIADSLPMHFKMMVEIAKKRFGVEKSEKKIIEEIRSKSYLELMKSFNISWTKIPMIFGIISKAREEVYNKIDTIKAFPGIKTTLKNLKNKDFRLLILSSNLTKTIDKFLINNKISEFEEVISESNILGKDSAIKNVISKHKLSNENTLYIGDEIRDIEACRSAGIKIIAVSWGLNTANALKKHGADFVVRKPSQILKIVSS